MYYCNRKIKLDPAENYFFIIKKYSWIDPVSVFIGKLCNDDINTFLNSLTSFMEQS